MMSILSPVILAVVMAGFAVPAMAETQTVTIHNHSDHAIVDLYADEYGDRGVIELLGDDELDPDESATFDIDDGDNDCVGDLRAVFDDGSEDEIEDANICDDHDYTFD